MRRTGQGDLGIAVANPEINYRRGMRIPSLRKAAAPLMGVVLVLAGCAAEENSPPQTVAGPCSVVPNGTPAPKTAAAPASGSATTSRNISTNPEVATGYRKDMTAVRTSTYAVVTANPLATQEACLVLNEGGTASESNVIVIHPACFPVILSTDTS